MQIHDLSLPISPSMVTWPGDPPVRIQSRLRIADGEVANVSEMCLGTHTGTHVDPPYHFDDHGMKVDELPLELLIGPAWVCEIDSERDIALPDLRRCLPQGVLRLLLKTSNSALWHLQTQQFTPDFVTLTAETARWIPEQGIRLAVVEGLDLATLRTGWYNLLCLPLKVAGGDGAPARAVAVGPLQ